MSWWGVFLLFLTFAIFPTNFYLVLVVNSARLGGNCAVTMDHPSEHGAENEKEKRTKHDKKEKKKKKKEQKNRAFHVMSTLVQKFYDPTAFF